MESVPRAEYPRPDFQRACWESLNGEWAFDFDDGDSGREKGYHDGSGRLGLRILVPFAYQTLASRIGDTTPHDIVWYQKEFDLPESMAGKRIFLNFGAVDYQAEVYLNGSLLGGHTGGYTPFKFEVTGRLRPVGNLLSLRIVDERDLVQPRGKQYWKEPEGCFYTPTTGIWQPVWLEAAEGETIESVKITPDLANGRILMELVKEGERPDGNVRVQVTFNGKPVASADYSVEGRYNRFLLTLPQGDGFTEPLHYWSPEEPNLYEIQFTYRKENRVCDQVESYFGMRTVSVEDGRILLNGFPYYLKMVLDQGYWRESGYTPPSDEALRYDVEMTKKYGFNGARKHQKIEDPRYYYWCDRLGLLVWGELPGAFRFCDAEIANLTRDMGEFIKRDYNHPCIMAWVPLNESWGVPGIHSDESQQSLADALYYLCKSLDSTRLVSANDGWDMVKSDILGIHDYGASGDALRRRYSPESFFQNLSNIRPALRSLIARGYSYEGQPVLITEYGGIALKSQNKDGGWGYAQAEDSPETLIQRYRDVTAAFLSSSFIQGFCYTQLTDVYQEVNGLLDADHKVKIPVEAIAEIHKLR